MDMLGVRSFQLGIRGTGIWAHTTTNDNFPSFSRCGVWTLGEWCEMSSYDIHQTATQAFPVVSLTLNDLSILRTLIADVEKRDHPHIYVRQY